MLHRIGHDYLRRRDTISVVAVIFIRLPIFPADQPNPLFSVPIRQLPALCPLCATFLRQARPGVWPRIGCES